MFNPVKQTPPFVPIVANESEGLLLVLSPHLQK